MDERDRHIDGLERQLRKLTRELGEKNRALEEASLKVQEANRLKTEFLARMSHDLRTPMNAIIGYARILLRRTKDSLEERQYQNLENIQTSAHSLLDLINDLLDLSKIEAGRVEVYPHDVDLPVLVRECTAAVAPLAGPNVEIRRELDSVGVIRSDPDRLRRALMNLLANALKFTEQGTVTVSLSVRDGWTEIAVADTGIGISAEDLPHIFDEFRQVARKGSTAQEGTGLGLAIVRRSVELLGGTIVVESTAGVGTKFTIRLKDFTPPPETSS